MPFRLVLAALIAATATPPLAFATPFAFHCSGNACRDVAFGDEGNGCTVVTNHGRFPVRVTQGTNQLDYVLQPGETKAPLSQVRCYGYYDGGETANYLR